MDGIVINIVEGRTEVSSWVLNGRLATHHVESGEGSGAGTELVGFQAETLTFNTLPIVSTPPR
jgi:hypothetical protein